MGNHENENENESGENQKRFVPVFYVIAGILLILLMTGFLVTNGVISHDASTIDNVMSGAVTLLVYIIALLDIVCYIRNRKKVHLIFMILTISACILIFLLTVVPFIVSHFR